MNREPLMNQEIPIAEVQGLLDAYRSWSSVGRENTDVREVSLSAEDAKLLLRASLWLVSTWRLSAELGHAEPLDSIEQQDELPIGRLLEIWERYEKAAARA